MAKPNHGNEKPPSEDNPPVDGDQPAEESGRSFAEGGRVSYSELYPTKNVPQRERVAERLAYGLVGILAGTIVIHYITMTILSLHSGSPTDYEMYTRTVDKVFNSLLPILSGLVGSAVTYYFTREARNSPS